MQIKETPKYQSDIASKPATGTQRCTLTKSKHLASVKAVKFGSLVHVRVVSKIDIRACFAFNSEYSETIEIRQRSVFFYVS